MKSYLNFLIKVYRYLTVFFKSRFSGKKNLLIMVGIDPAYTGELRMIYPNFHKCYCFEANPYRYELLIKRYNRMNNVFIYNYAVSEEAGEVELNISSNNNGASSSLGTFSEKWLKTIDDQLEMVEKVKVKAINLYQFIQDHNIQYIDDYISDIQGMDLQVLKTMKPMIDEKKIKSIRCEVTKDKYGNIYENLPDNSETGFKNLLSKNYSISAKGYGLLNDGQYDVINDDNWEFDCKWKIK